MDAERIREIAVEMILEFDEKVDGKCLPGMVSADQKVEYIKKFPVKFKDALDAYAIEVIRSKAISLATLEICTKVIEEVGKLQKKGGWSLHKRWSIFCIGYYLKQETEKPGIGER